MMTSMHNLSCLVYLMKGCNSIPKSRSTGSSPMDSTNHGDDEPARNVRPARVEIPAIAASSARPAASRQAAQVLSVRGTDLDDGLAVCPFVSGTAVVSLRPHWAKDHEQRRRVAQLYEPHLRRLPPVPDVVPELAAPIPVRGAMQRSSARCWSTGETSCSGVREARPRHYAG